MLNESRIEFFKPIVSLVSFATKPIHCNAGVWVVERVGVIGTSLNRPPKLFGGDSSYQSESNITSQASRSPFAFLLHQKPFLCAFPLSPCMKTKFAKHTVYFFNVNVLCVCTSTFWLCAFVTINLLHKHFHLWWLLFSQTQISRCHTCSLSNNVAIRSAKETSKDQNDGFFPSCWCSFPVVS